VLWLIALYLVAIGTLGGKPTTEAVTSQILGVVLAIAGALLTGADQLNASEECVSTTLSPTSDLDRGIAVSVAPGPTRTTGIRSIDRPATATATILQLLNTAEASGWTVARTAGARDVTLSKTILQPPAGSNRFVAGDTVTVTIPVDDLHSPVPPHVAATMEAAGFEMSY
jgi:hypothetical protein